MELAGFILTFRKGKIGGAYWIQVIEGLEKM